MKKILLILIVLLLSGCSNYNEMSDLGTITGLGIDYKDGNFYISASMINFKDNKESVISLKSHNTSINTALNDLSLISSKNIYLEHLMVVVISEEVYKNHLKNVIDFFKNNSSTPLSFNVIISDNAEKIIDLTSPLDTTNSTYLINTIKLNNEYEGFASVVTFDELLDRYYSEGISLILTKVKTSDSFKSEEKNSSLIEITSLATLNNKLQINYLNKYESIGYNLLMNKIETTLLKIDCDDSYYTIELKWNKSKIKVKDKDKIDINITSFGTVNEFNCDITDDKKINSYVLNTTKNKINSIINSTINKSKSTNTDFLGIGKYLYAYQYKYFNKVNDIFENELLKDINFNINIDLQIDRINNVGDNKEGSDYNKQ